MVWERRVLLACALLLAGALSVGCVQAPEFTPSGGADAVADAIFDADASADVSADADAGVPQDASVDIEIDSAAASDADVQAETAGPSEQAPSVVSAWLVGTSEGDGWRMDSVGTSMVLRGTSTSVEGWTMRSGE